MHTLVLFDIDGTLYTGDRSGWAAFCDAARAIFGDEFVEPPFEFSGRLDPWILSRMLEHNRIELTEDRLNAFRARCHECLRARIESGRHRVAALPGTIDLVRRLGRERDVTLGLLTGNWTENGRLKIRSVGFDPDWFPVGAWGEDAPTREELPPIARRRFHEHHGNGLTIDYDRILIVGDTVHDIACARAHGCRVLAVGTGGGTMDELHAARPDRLVEDLSDTDDITGWILGSPREATG